MVWGISEEEEEEEEEVGIARDKWMDRSEEPVKR